MNDFRYDVSVIFVNYFTHELLTDATCSIMEKTKGLSFEIIIVDNSNDQEEYSRLRTLSLHYRNIKVIDAKNNLGFGKGNNLGYSHASGRYILFLNCDTLLINNAIFEMKTFLDTHESVSVVGANLYTSRGRPNHSFSKKEKNVVNMIKENRVFRILWRHLSKKRDDFNYNGCPMCINGYVCGAALMIKSDDFSSVFGFDQDIFMYAEETLLCYKVINMLKKEIYNIPSARIIHMEGGSFKGITDKRAKMIIDGNVVYFTKAFGKEEAVRFLIESINIYRKKAKLSFIFSKDNASAFNILIKECKLKLDELYAE